MSRSLSTKIIRFALAFVTAGFAVPVGVVSAAGPRCPQGTEGTSCFCPEGDFCLAFETQINNPAYVHFRVFLGGEDTHANIREGTEQWEVKSGELSYVSRGTNGTEVHAQACNRGSYCGHWRVFKTAEPAPPNPQRPATPHRQVNTRFYGTALRGVNGAFVSDCMEQCSRDAGKCKGWTWYEQSNKCYLWQEISKTEPNDCCVSGVVTADAAPPAERPVKRMGKSKTGEDRKITKEECEAEGSLWIPQKERCIGKALLSALRTVCEKKGADFRFDPQTAQCIGP